MMDALTFYHDILGPGLIWVDRIMPGLNTPMAARFLLAVAQQESGLRWRQQIGGPANSWFMFERVGCAGVLSLPATRSAVLAACALAAVEPLADQVHAAITGHDNLAVALARLLLRSDPNLLPTEPAAGWQTYLRLWRPGRPRPETWADYWAAASAAIFGPVAKVSA